MSEDSNSSSNNNDVNGDYVSDDDVSKSDNSSEAASADGLTIPSGGGSTTGTGDRRESTTIRRRDPQLRMIRVIVFMVLFVAGVIVCAFVFYSARSAQTAEFDLRWTDQSEHIGDAFISEAASKMSNVDAFAITVQSHALLNRGQIGATWPLVSLPEFSYRASSILTNARAETLAMIPRVETNEKRMWEDYSVDHQGWREEGFAFQERFPDALQGSTGHGEHGGEQHDHRQLIEEMTHGMASGTNESSSQLRSIAEVIWNVHDGKPVRETGYGPYFPLWQHVPVHPGFPWVNYNMADVDIDIEAIQVVLNSENAVLGKYFDLSKASHGHDFPQVDEQYQENENLQYRRMAEMEHDASMDHNPNMSYGIPAASLWYPIFDEFDGNRTVVALLDVTVRFDSFFLHSLPPNANGIYCVVSNPCGQVFTFKIENEMVEFLGFDDLHEVEYEDYVLTQEMEVEGSTFTGIPLNDDYCRWKVDVYPSYQMEIAFYDNTPAIYAGAMAAIFIFTGLLLLLYDYLVERRQRYLADTANKTNAIVSSLFPDVVRDRLFENKNHSNVKKFMNDPSLGVDQTEGVRSGSAPIADLFPDCTVMFGDIAGFTAWSSAREPSQVFILLETVYGAFDKIAKRHGVFKVETIGDCYLAVTGLPDPQADHAIRMVKFSMACIDQVKELTKELEVSLGPDTADISFRIGLHSGPVTAGVLRGEKSRFQLFGDTVNTAARMESLGKAGMIQVSQETAMLIQDGGKGQWLRKRQDKVQAKGKGQLETYWINPSNRLDPGSKRQSMRRLHSSTTSEAENAQRQRLINWNVDLFSSLLKKVVMQRQKRAFKRRSSKHDLMQDDSSRHSFAGLIDDPVDNTLPRDEVTEAIKLHKVVGARIDQMEDLDSFELDPEVTEQLTEFIKAVSCLYHDNHFHNFEHACNVTMAARKFLCRVVSPDSHHAYTYGITNDPMIQFAIVFSALIHDLDHTGVSNFQLIKEGARIAALYDNKSVAEQNSVDLAWQLLTSPEYSDLLHAICATDDDYRRFRQLVVNAVLATDIFDKELVEFRNNRWKRAFHPDHASEHDDLDLKATIVLEHIIQTSDVGHTMQHWHMYQKWNQRLFFEMYEAYLNGRGDKDPSLGWYKGEMWFFDNYVIPLGKKLKECKVFGVASDECLNYALQNRKEWEEKGEAIVEDLVQKYKSQYQTEDDQPMSSRTRSSKGSEEDV